MQKQLLELETLLEQEIDACSKLEQYIDDKRICLVKGDLKGIASADVELEKYNSAVEKLEEKKKQLYPDKSSLTEIIESINEKPKALRLSNLRDKLGSSLTHIQKQNNINAELLMHSLKVIEGSIASFVNVLVPENSSYNHKGKFIKDEATETISSVIHEV